MTFCDIMPTNIMPTLISLHRLYLFLVSETSIHEKSHNEKSLAIYIYIHCTNFILNINIYMYNIYTYTYAL